jgi:molybdate transport system substrate-binding protein
MAGSRPHILRAVAIAAALATPVAVKADEVVVFAAASMKTALDDFAARWSAETGHDVVLSYAGSGALARQIIESAPADIFISAAINWMDEVANQGLIAGDARRDLLGNTLVLIAHGTGAAPVEIGPGFDLAGLLGDEKLAMALVDSVPAGQYGKAALTTLGIWDAIVPSVAQTDNVRAALALVSTGEAPYGIVYATDAAADDNVTIVGTFPAESYPPIIYPAALLTGAADVADRDFYEALTSDAARAAFEAQGFAVLD